MKGIAMGSVDMKIVGIALTLLAALIAGCDFDDNGVSPCCEDTQPPAVPTGVGSITGDGYVIVYWNPVYEEDLAGYGIYRSGTEFGRYARIGEVGWDGETNFTDEDLTNSVTYYYAVDAFDDVGNSSDLSYETVDDTPRPEGWDLAWYAREYRPEASGIAILPNRSDELAVLAYNNAATQYYLKHDDQGCMRIVPTRDASGFLNLIQDYGYTTSGDDVDHAPTEGWSSCADGVEVIVGHTYVLYTSSGYYGKVRVEQMDSQGIIVYWAFQGKRGSTELAPVRGASPTRG